MIRSMDLGSAHHHQPITSPIGSGPRVAKKSSFKKIISHIKKFIKKYKIAIIIVVVVVAIGAVSFVFIPVVAVGPYRFVDSNTPVRLELDQNAKLKYSDVSVKINKFIEGTCPVGECFGSGHAVDYDIYINGQKFYATSLTSIARISRYQIETIKTDNKTYAEIKIIDSKK